MPAQLPPGLLSGVVVAAALLGCAVIAASTRCVQPLNAKLVEGRLALLLLLLVVGSLVHGFTWTVRRFTK